MVVQMADHILGDQRASLQPLENGKVGDSRQGHAAPDGAQVFEGFLIVEGEDEAGNPHNRYPANESDKNGGKNAGDDRQSFGGIDVAGQFLSDARFPGPNFKESCSHGAAQQFKNNGNRGGSGKAERVENVQQDNIRQHDRQKDQHDVMEGKPGRHEYAASGDFHHAAGEQRADDDTQSGHQHNRPARSGLGTDGGVQKVGGVIGNSDNEVEAG